jgi:hypothetical protein
VTRVGAPRQVWHSASVNLTADEPRLAVETAFGARKVPPERARASPPVRARERIRERTRETERSVHPSTAVGGGGGGGVRAAAQVAQKFWPYLDFRRARPRPLAAPPLPPWFIHTPSLTQASHPVPLPSPPPHTLRLDRRLAPATRAAATARQRRLLGEHPPSNYG